MRAALYARVSTPDQTAENQVLVLRRWAESRGHEVIGEFVDTGVSGAKERRSALDRLLKACHQGDVDVVAATALDRLGRSLKHLVTLADDLRARGIGLYIGEEGLDTTTPSGELLFHVLAALAQFERALIRERVMAGLARARAQGKRLGRPTVPTAKENEIRHLHRQGHGIRKIAKRLGVGTSVVQRVVGPSHG